MQRATFSVEEAAQVLGISRGSAYARVHDGGIPSIRVGKRILVPTELLASLLAGERLSDVGAREPSGAIAS